MRPAQPQVGRPHAPGRRRVAGRLCRRVGRAHRHGVRLLPAAAGGQHVPALQGRRLLPRRGGHELDVPRAAGACLGAVLRPPVRARLRRPQVRLLAALHHRRRAQGGHHLAVQVPDAAPRGGTRRGQGAHLLGQLLLAEAAAGARGGDDQVPHALPQDRAGRLQGDGRGDTRLPVLLDLPDVHPQVHSQGQVPLHAALAAAARLLRIPQQGGRQDGDALPQEAHRHQDGQGALL
mmetsp:Transcript_21637/g.51316  ORF Transcript_21637/g.51316 Transcript_21637/m.51316 type:complete len:234 (-) Transcript_21637:676-1377(-)